MYIYINIYIYPYRYGPFILRHDWVTKGTKMHETHHCIRRIVPSMLLQFRKCHHEGIGSHDATGGCEKSSEKKR